MAIPDSAPRFRDDVRGGSGSAARRLAVARLENHNLDRVCIRRAADAKRPAVVGLNLGASSSRDDNFPPPGRFDQAVVASRGVDDRQRASVIGYNKIADEMPRSDDIAEALDRLIGRNGSGIG